MGAIERRARVEGAVWGLLVGDALGVPYEFHAAHEIPPADAIEMVPPDGFRRAHAGVPPGTWSDDGAHALCLLASLLGQDRLDPDDLMRRLTNGYQLGYLAVDYEVFDVGVQTRRALERFAAGDAPLDCGGRGERDNGNGSLMRALPLALWHRGDDAALVADAQLQSRITHGHVRAQVACASYCLWARRIADGAADPWAAATAGLRALYRPGSDERAVVDEHIRPDEPPGGSGSGYVIDCLRSARLALGAGDYPAVVRAAIRLGDDTDTTACVAGGLAGLRDGVAAIPARWRAALRGTDLVAPLLDALLARLA